jgi:hypothetical protein
MDLGPAGLVLVDIAVEAERQHDGREQVALPCGAVMEPPARLTAVFPLHQHFPHFAGGVQGFILSTSRRAIAGSWMMSRPMCTVKIWTNVAMTFSHRQPH